MSDDMGARELPPCSQFKGLFRLAKEKSGGCRKGTKAKRVTTSIKPTLPLCSKFPPALQKPLYARGRCRRGTKTREPKVVNKPTQKAYACGKFCPDKSKASSLVAVLNSIIDSVMLPLCAVFAEAKKEALSQKRFGLVYTLEVLSNSCQLLRHFLKQIIKAIDGFMGTFKAKQRPQPNQNP